MNSSSFHGGDSFRLRWPASEALSAPVELDVSLDRLRIELLGPKFTMLSCAHILDETSEHVLDPRRLEKPLDAAKIVRQTFELQTLVHTRLKEFGSELAKTPTCQTSLRHFLNRLRVVADMAAERVAGLPEADDEGRPAVLQGGTPYLLVNPTFTSAQLKTGDILLTRGTTFLPTAAARLYGPESLFTQVEVVEIDDSTGQAWGIGESVALGLWARPLTEWLGIAKVRVLVLRPMETAVSKEAADWLFKKAQVKKDQAPSEHAFDFEQLREAYAHVSKGALKLPLSNSHLSAKAKDLLESFGLKAESAFSPEDLELDPRLDFVAEWRDLGLTSESRMRDAVLTAMLSWIDQDHYSFKEISPSGVKKLLADHLPNWPLLSTWLKADTPNGVDPKGAEVLRAFDETGEVLYAHVEDVCDQVKDTIGRWPTPAEMAEELETYRRTDLKIYEEYQKTRGYDPLARRPDFHLLFRP